MLLTSAIAVFLIAWSCVFLFDYVLRLRNFGPYVRLANRLGLEVSPFHLRFYVAHSETSDNEVLIKDDDAKKRDIISSLDDSRRGKCRRVVINIWFSLGALISIVCLVGITVYLFHVLLNDVSRWLAFRPKGLAYHRGMQEYRLMPTTTTQEAAMNVEAHAIVTDEEYDMIDDGQKAEGLVPIIPGFNLPYSHIPIFMIVLVVAAVFHELGHAWAATSNGIIVNGFGVFVLAVYPGAFTDIEPTSLNRASPFRRLQVFGAGIWHNLILAAIAVAVFTAAPIIMSPLLVEGRGVSVRAVDARSGLSHGATGLRVGDIVVSVDECPVATILDWRMCIEQTRQRRDGRCVDKEAVEAATAFNTWTSTDEIHCCDEFNVTTAHVCFEREGQTREKRAVGIEASTAPQLNTLLGIVEDKKAETGKDNADTVPKTEEPKKTVQYSCLNARHVVEQSVCNVSTPCSKEENESSDRLCVYPALFNGTRLVKIEIVNRHKSVLFVGQLNEMLEMVAVDGSIGRFSFVDIEWIEDVRLAAKYLFTLSLALALLNALPCYALDGQFIVSTLLQCTSLSTRRRRAVRFVILSFGSVLLVLNIISGFVRLALR